MGFHFYHRFHLAPGLSLNVSRSGPSLSIGVRGAHVTVGRRGVTKTIGLPGSGLFYTSRTGLLSGYHSAVIRTPLTTPVQQRQADGRVERAVIVMLLMVCAALVGVWLGLQ